MLKRRGAKALCFHLLGFFLLVSCGGGGAPPASIPAPVSQKLSISPPAPNGAITITGEPGAVQPGARVQAKNVTEQGPFLIVRSFWIRSALAQTFETETFADDFGAFSLLIDGASGDQIDVRQEVGGEFSSAVSLTVP